MVGNLLVVLLGLLVVLQLQDTACLSSLQSHHLSLESLQAQDSEMIAPPHVGNMLLPGLSSGIPV